MAGDEAEPSNTTIDIYSPYFLTSSDHPGQNFVGDNLLKDINYSDWKNEMVNALLAKNKYGFVDGSIRAPKEGSKDYMNWKRCNAMVRGWLVNSMEREIKTSVKYAGTAQEIWDDLKERFDKDNAPRAYELRRMITTIHQGNLSISAYYTKLRGIWDEIESVTPIPTCTCEKCTCDLAKKTGIIRDKERLYDFLMGLNEEYNTIKTQILSSDPIPSVRAAFHLTSQDEQQRNIGLSKSTNSDATAFQSYGKNTRPTEKTNNQNHYKKDEKSEEQVCTECWKTGHTIDGCFKIIGYPEWWTKKAGNPKSQPNKARNHTRAAAVAVNEDKPMTSLTTEDYNHLMQLIRATKLKETPTSANMTGLAFDEPDWDG